MIITEWIKLKYYRWHCRRWFKNGKCHRGDGGPAFEDMRNDYCAWWRCGEFVKDNDNGMPVDQ